MPGMIESIEPGSVAANVKLQPGDLLLAVNGRAVRDVIDVQFYGADDELTFTVERNGSTFDAHAYRGSGQSLGIVFEHPTFDIDIRRCNNLCPFCFVLQNAPRMRRTLYIKDDDYRYSFLFGHFVTLTNLSEEDWARLAEQRLSPLYISVHATDPEVRRKCLRNPTSGDILAQLRWLADHGIEMHTQLVITPGLNDGRFLEQSIQDLAALHPHVQSVSVVPVGLTRHHKYGHRPHTRAEADHMIDTVEAWQETFRTRLGVRFAYLTDEWYLVANRPLPKKRSYDGLALQENGLGMVRDFLGEWQRLKKSEASGPLAGAKYQHATLVTATLFAPTLEKVAREFTRRTGVPLDVVAIRNERLGETITVAGLLMGQDVINQLASYESQSQSQSQSQSKIQNPKSEIVILPRVMFDHPDGVSLDDTSPITIARALGKPVALADWMGDVIDALLGQNRLVFDPAIQDSTIPIAREGGWAVEKYL